MQHERGFAMSHACLRRRAVPLAALPHDGATCRSSRVERLCKDMASVTVRLTLAHCGHGELVETRP